VRGKPLRPNRAEHGFVSYLGRFTVTCPASPTGCKPQGAYRDDTADDRQNEKHKVGISLMGLSVRRHE
jgi:hypothetical protein